VTSRSPPFGLPLQTIVCARRLSHLKTAKALGLTIPQTLLQRADQVIQ